MADSDIILDPYVLQDSGKAGSSLTDLNEIPVFTTKFQEKVTAAERTQKRQETLSQHCDFLIRTRPLVNQKRRLTSVFFLIYMILLFFISVFLQCTRK